MDTRLLSLVLVISVLSAILVVPLFGMATGAGKLYVISRYQGLQMAQVLRVQEDTLEEFKNGIPPDEQWIDIPEYLTGEAFRYVHLVALGFVLVHIASSLVVLLVIIIARKYTEEGKGIQAS